MSRVVSLPRLLEAPAASGHSPTACVLVIVGDRTVGLGYHDGMDLGFVATDERFRLLEGSRFRRIEQIEQAARHLAAAASPAGDAAETCVRPRLVWSRELG
jgi:hypothetical protein